MLDRRDRRGRGRGFRHALRQLDLSRIVGRAQRVEGGLQRVEARQQLLDVGTVDVTLRAQQFDLGFHAVRALAQAHGAGQPGTALERVQRTQHRGARRAVVGVVRPLAQRLAELRQQFGRLFLEDREQVDVDRVGQIDGVLGVVKRHVGAALRRHHLQRCARLVACQLLGIGRGHRRGRDVAQRLQRLLRGVAQQADRELVQQAAQLVGRGDQHHALLARAAALHLQVLQRGLEVARHARQAVEADRGRAAGQRMGQRDGRVGHAFVGLQRPLADLGGELARPFVGLVEVDVVERDADAQRADHLDLVVGAAGGGHLDGVDGFDGHGLRLGNGRRLRGGRGLGLHRFLGLGRCLQRQGLGRDIEQRGGLGRGRFGRDHGGLGELGRSLHGLELDLGEVDRRGRAGIAGFAQRQRLGRPVEVGQRGRGGLGALGRGLRGVDRQRGGRQFGQAGGLDRGLLGRLGRLRGGADRRQEIEVDAVAQRGRQRCRRGGRRLAGLEVEEVGGDEVVVLRAHGARRGLRHVGGVGGVGRFERQVRQLGQLGQRLRGRGRQRELRRQLLERGRRGGQGIGGDLARRDRERLGIGHARRRGRHRLAGQQGFGEAAERGGLPAMRRRGRDVLDPQAEVAQRLLRAGQQLGGGGALVGQPGVDHLFERPGGVAEVGEADHARAALERVERAAQDRELVGVLGAAAERDDRVLAVVHHLARLVEEDVLQVVFLELGDLGVGQRAGADDLGGPAVGLAAEFLDRRGLGLARRRGQRGQLRRDLGIDFLDAEQGLGGRRGHALGVLGIGGLAAHQRLEFADLGVEDEQALGQRRLVAQHVDQEAERAEVVAQRVEAGHLVGRRGTAHHGLHVVAHALHGVGGLVEAEHREHAAHLLQLARHGAQQALFARAAEILVERLLEFAQVAAQLVDHGAHGLAVADAAVQVLHPGLERLGMAARAHALDAPGELEHALGELRIAGVEVFECGLEVEHRGRDFHRELGVGRLAAAHRGVDRMRERLHHRLARRMQPVQRFTELGEGVGHLAGARDVAAREAGPHLLGGLDALAGLGQHQRIEAAELLDRVVDALFMRDAPGRAHAAQGGGFVARGGHGLGAEEQQVLAEPVGHHAVAARERGVLQQHARGGALDVAVGGHEAQRQRLEEAGRQGPEAGHARQQRAAAEPQAQRLQAARGLRVAGLDQLQHLAVEPRAHRGVVGQRGLRERGTDLDPAPAGAPEIGRMHALVADQFEHVAVLREQRDRGHVLAGQQGLQEIGDGEARALDLQRGAVGAALRFGHEALHRELDRAEHQRGRVVAHHLQRADGLVQLLARHLQRTALDLGRIADVAREAAQRLADVLERLLDFSEHPGQRPEVFGGRRIAGEGGRDGGLDSHLGCSPFFCVRQS